MYLPMKLGLLPYDKPCLSPLGSATAYTCTDALQNGEEKPTGASCIQPNSDSGSTASFSSGASESTSTDPLRKAAKSLLEAKSCDDIILVRFRVVEFKVVITGILFCISTEVCS